MSQLFYDLTIQVSHKNIVAVIQGPDIFVAVFLSIGYRRAGISAKMSGCIYDMLAIFHESAACRSSFSAAYFFVFKFLTWLWYFTDKHFITHNSFLRVGALKNDPLAVKTEIGFGIIPAKSELLNVFKMCFFGVLNGIGEW